MTIITSYGRPPIPIREMDWSAWELDREEGAIGYGATEAAAVADLTEQIEEGAESVRMETPR